MTLEQFNTLPLEEVRIELERCCGSTRWIEGMIQQRPFDSPSSMYQHSDRIWNSLSESDWKEAFTHHPKIGDMENLRAKFASTSTWAEGEQSGVQTATEITLNQLANGNKDYENKFGYIFIVCATGKSAEEMLTILQQRLLNSHSDEIHIAASEQTKITKIRLHKLFS